MTSDVFDPNAKAGLSRRRILQLAAASTPVMAGFLLSSQPALASTATTSLSVLPRPTGAGIYPYETLRISGLNLIAAMSAAVSAGKRDGVSRPTLTLPAGVFETRGFGQSANDNGFLVPPNLSIVGSGSGTIIRVVPNTVTSTQATKVIRIITVANSSWVKIAQLTIQGNSQSGKLYGGMQVWNCSNSQIADVLFTGIPGNYNSPPGETFALNISACSTMKLNRVETDGRDATGRRVQATGIGVNNSNGLEMRDCYTHHSGYAHGVAMWQSSNITTWNHRAEYNGLHPKDGGSWGSVGCGLNHEKTRNTTHYSSRLGYNSLSEIRYFAMPASGADRYSGNTGGHTLSGLTLTDGGRLDIHMDSSQWAQPVLTSSPAPNFIRG